MYIAELEIKGFGQFIVFLRGDSMKSNEKTEQVAKLWLKHTLDIMQETLMVALVFAMNIANLRCLFH